jgi:hypothetical protein
MLGIIEHVSQHRISFFGQKKWLTSTCSVFLAPKYPIRPLECASFKSILRREQSRMQSLLTRNRNPSWKLNFFHPFP